MVKTWSIHALIFGAILNALYGCTESGIDKMLTTHSWTVVSMTTPDSGINQPAPKPYQVTFKDNGVAGISLDVNACDTHYTLHGKSLQFAPIACTEACCDSHFAEALVQLMSNSNFHCSMEGIDLVLRGAGEVRLRRTG